MIENEREFGHQPWPKRYEEKCHWSDRFGLVGWVFTPAIKSNIWI